MVDGKLQPGTGTELVRGFRLLRLPMAPGVAISRNLLVKRDDEQGKDERTTKQGRTLFVTHLDGFVTELQLKRCFGACFGPVEAVELQSVEKKAAKAWQRSDGIRNHVSFARVIFQEAASLNKVLSAATGRICGTAVLPLPPSQLKEQLRAAKEMYCDPVTLRREVDEWMVKYDEREEQRKHLARETQVDEDGFTKVISGITRTADGITIRSAARPQVRTGAFSEPLQGGQDPSATSGDRRKKKPKTKEMPDFYRFQLREKRYNELMDHRKRKSLDQKKVEHMRKTKKFKVAKTATDGNGS